MSSREGWFREEIDSYILRRFKSRDEDVEAEFFLRDLYVVGDFEAASILRYGIRECICAGFFYMASSFFGELEGRTGESYDVSEDDFVLGVESVLERYRIDFKFNQDARGISEVVAPLFDVSRRIGGRNKGLELLIRAVKSVGEEDSIGFPMGVKTRVVNLARYEGSFQGYNERMEEVRWMYEFFRENIRPEIVEDYYGEVDSLRGEVEAMMNEVKGLIGFLEVESQRGRKYGKLDLDYMLDEGANIVADWSLLDEAWNYAVNVSEYGSDFLEKERYDEMEGRFDGLVFMQSIAIKDEKYEEAKRLQREIDVLKAEMEISSEESEDSSQ